MLSGGNLYVFMVTDVDYGTFGEHSVEGTVDIMPYCVVLNFSSGDLGLSI